MPLLDLPYLGQIYNATMHAAVRDLQEISRNLSMMNLKKTKHNITQALVARAGPWHNQRIAESVKLFEGKTRSSLDRAGESACK